MAVRFDAAADRLLRTTNLPSYDANYSLSFWIYFPSRPGSGSYNVIFAIDNNSTHVDYIALYGQSASDTRLQVGTADGNYYETNGATNLGPATWYHIGFVRSANNSRIAYLNGVQQINHTQTHSSRFAPTRMEFGAVSSSNTDPYSGRVAAIKIWTTNLSLSQILAERFTYTPQNFTNLHLWSPGLAGATERLRDYSVNQYNWTESGTLTDEAGPPIRWGMAWDVIVPVTAAGATNYTLTAAQASFTETGQAAGLLFGHRLTAAQASYTETGQAAGLLFGHRLTADQVGYTLTGQTANLNYSGGVLTYTLTAAQTSFTLTGQSVNLIATRQLLATQTSFTETGQTIGLLFGRVIGAAQASYAETGQPAGLIATRQLLAAQAALALTGQAAGFARGRGFIAEAGSYTETGQAAGLFVARLIVAIYSSYTMTGQLAALNYSGAVSVVTDGRVYLVEAESRVLAVEAESRVLMVELENRVYTVGD